MPRAYPWPNEIELLLACARKEMAPADVERARAVIAEGMDWDRLAPAAHAHGLVPLVHRHAANARVNLPDAVFEHLRRMAQRITGRNLSLTAELLALLAEFSRAGIRVLPLKGPVLAERVYGSVGLRRIVDLDLAVAPADFAAASCLIEARGFQRQTVFPPGYEALEAGVGKAVSFPNRDRAIRIELHRCLTPPTAGRAATLEDVRDYLQPGRFMGADIQEFTPHALIAYLAHHGGSHAWERLEWLAALAELRRSEAIDMEAALAAAATLGGTRRLRAAYALADVLLEGGKPVSGRDPWTGRASSLVLHNLARHPTAGRAPRWHLPLYGFYTDEGPGARWRRLAIALGRPSELDVAIVRLPPVLWPLYRVVRPLRLAAGAIRRARTGRRRAPTSL